MPTAVDAARVATELRPRTMRADHVVLRTLIARLQLPHQEVGWAEQDTLSP